jgi:broad-specificity NMP kinase
LVGAVNSSVTDDASTGRPLLAELVGPPGAGKSTVFQALLARNEAIEARPSLRRKYLAGFSRDVLAALGTLLRQRAYLRGVSPEQVRMMAYLQALPRILERAEWSSGRIIVFDQGPVYFLTRPSLMDGRLVPWRERMLDTWASLLDVVVLLGAPDSLLIERLNERDKWHALKGSAGGTALDSLRKSRAVYENALSDLEERPLGPTVLRFDTGRSSTEEVADGILEALDDCVASRSPERPRGTPTRLAYMPPRVPRS